MTGKPNSTAVMARRHPERGGGDPMTGTFDLGPTGPETGLLEGALPGGAGAVMAGRAPVADGELDYFPTPPWAARAGGALITGLDPAARTCWEPACGEGHMAWGLEDYFKIVRTSDIFDYSATNPDQGSVRDFLRGDVHVLPGLSSVDWVVSNPPFKDGEAFIRQAWAIATRGVAMLLRLQFIEGGGRHKLFTVDCPLTMLAPFSERVPMVKGRWDPEASSATAYAWFIFAKPGVVASAADWPNQLRLIPPGTKARLTKTGDRARFGLAETAALDLAGDADE